ncbi:MAG: T9SS type A sorting domain-containing protein [Bacteroidota bacterium]
MKITTFTRSLPIILMMTILSSVAWAQTPSSYLCSIRNDSLLTSKIYEFDIYLQKTDLSNVFELATFQAGIIVNSSILNGGTISATIVAGSSQLLTSQQPTAITFAGSPDYCIKLAPRSGPGHGSGAVISNVAPGTKVVRIRLTNTADFGQFSPNFAFNFVATPYNSIVSAYDQTSGVNIVITNAANQTVATMTNPILNAPVTAFNLTGGGTYCSGSTGALVGLDGSQTGVVYNLVKNTIATATNVAGTGAAVSFGLQTAGTYTATAYRKATYLTGTMTGSAIETPTTVLPTLSGLTSVCNGTTGVIYTTETGKTNYIWSVPSGGTITSGGTTSSNTATITWSSSGSQTVTVNYTDLGCTAATPTTYTVSVNALPVPAITGLATVCSGTSGVTYSTAPGMSGYSWAVSAGGAIITGATTNFITVNWNTAGAQTISVTYSDGNSCAALAPTLNNITINQSPTAPVVSTITQPTCTLATGSVLLTGLPSGSWTINPGPVAGSTATTTLSGLATGIHNYTVTNSLNCPSIPSGNVSIAAQPVSPTVNLGSNVTLCGNQSVVLDAGNAGSQFLWTPGGQITQTKSVDSVGLGMGAHTISVLVTAANTCSTSASITVTFDACTTIADDGDGVSIGVSPNPSSGLFYLTVNGLNEKAELTIYSTSGQIVYTEKLDNAGFVNKLIDLKSYPKGMYFIRLVTTHAMHSQKIVIQ